MKKYMYLLAVLFVILAFSSCAKQEERTMDVGEQSLEYSVLDEDTSRILRSDNIPNVEKIRIIDELADSQYAKAEEYEEQIHQVFEKSVAESAFFADKKDFLDDAKRSVAEYCQYLREEYDANTDFFESCAMIKYEGGTAESFYLAWNKYECAKNYADKLEKLYKDLCGQ